MELHSVNILHTRRGKASVALAGALFLAASAQVALATTEPPADTEGTEAAGTEPAGTEAMGTEAADGTLPPYEGELAGGEVFVTGSSTVEPISIRVGELAGELSGGDLAVTVEGPGTGDGFAKFCAGERRHRRRLAARSSEEEAQICADNGIEYVELEVAIDGLTVATSPDNADINCLDIPACTRCSGRSPRASPTGATPASSPPRSGRRTPTPSPTRRLSSAAPVRRAARTTRSSSSRSPTSPRSASERTACSRVPTTRRAPTTT